MFAKNQQSGATLAVRGIRDATSFALPIQQLVQQLDPELPVSDILTMDQMIGKSTLDASFDAMLVLAFAVLSLVLAGVGLFGVLSYVIARRTPEIGIRVALGAQRENVLKLVMLDGLRPAFFGLAFGIAGGIAAAQLIRSMSDRDRNFAAGRCHCLPHSCLARLPARSNGRTPSRIKHAN